MDLILHFYVYETPVNKKIVSVRSLDQSYKAGNCMKLEKESFEKPVDSLTRS